MESRRGQISKTIVALLFIVVRLASSTVYLAVQADRPRSTSLSVGGTATPMQVGPLLPRFNVTIVPDQNSGTASSSANSITVSGSGEVTYTPNEALVQVSVQTVNLTATGATSSNAQEMARVIAALNGIGISNSSIETQGYTLTANYANCYSSCIPEITGYSVTNLLQVNITSKDPTELGLKAGQVIDTSVNAGANGISLSFGSTAATQSQLVNEALQNAVASADNQAQAIASSLGVSISGVISASESSTYSPYYAQPARAAAISTPTPIMPGTQTFSATVEVVYSIG